MLTAGRLAQDRRTLQRMWQMVAYGLTVFIFGFVVWGIDNHHCNELRKWRHRIGLPWGILLKGHGWW